MPGRAEANCTLSADCNFDIQFVLSFVSFYLGFVVDYHKLSTSMFVELNQMHLKLHPTIKEISICFG